MTYTLSLASADVVRQADHVVRVTHEDGRLDRLEGIPGEGGAGTAAKGVVHDLTALRVADQHDLGVGAAVVEVGDGLDHGLGALLGRVLVADAAAVGLAAAGRVADGVAGRARVGLLHHVDEPLRGAISGRHGRLASTKDVHLRAGLAGLDGVGAGKSSEDGDGNGGNLHFEYRAT